MILAVLLHLLFYENILLLLGAGDYRSEKLLTFTIHFYSISKPLHGSQGTSQTTFKRFLFFLFFFIQVNSGVSVGSFFYYNSACNI